MKSRRGVIIGSLVSSAALVAVITGPALAASPPAVSIPVPPALPAPPVAPVTGTPPAQVGNLNPGHPILNFTGAVNNPTPLPAVSDPTPPACAIECQEYQFHNVAPGRPILVSIKSTSGGGTFDPNDGYNLYVYDPSGKLAGSSNGVGANGQAVLIEPSAAGTYTIVVTVTYAYDTGAGWVGEIRLIDSKTWNPPAATCNITIGEVTGCFELPTLRVLPPYDFTASGVPPVVSTPLGFPLPASLPTPTSCYADETIGLDNPSPTAVTNPVTRCLRFTSDVQNTGAGPVRVGIPLLTADSSGQPQSGYVPGDCHAVQYVTATSGSTVTRPAGDCEFHPEHGHFHYDALVGYSLHSVDSSGGIGPAVSVSHKESFCLTDDDYFGYGTAGPNGPRQNVGQPDCNLPRSITTPTGGPGNGTYVTEGISPGWGDVYTWDTPDQYIDVTHVPSGIYWVVEETNPSGTILVAGPAQTCSATEINLTSSPNSSTGDTVQALQSVAGVACPA